MGCFIVKLLWMISFLLVIDCCAVLERCVALCHSAKIEVLPIFLQRAEERHSWGEPEPMEPQLYGVNEHIDLNGMVSALQSTDATQPQPGASTASAM